MLEKVRKNILIQLETIRWRLILLFSVREILENILFSLKMIIVKRWKMFSNDECKTIFWVLKIFRKIFWYSFQMMTVKWWNHHFQPESKILFRIFPSLDIQSRVISSFYNHHLQTWSKYVFVNALKKLNSVIKLFVV